MGKKIVEKLEGLVGSLRESLDKHDGSALQALFNNARDGIDSVKESLSESKRARKLWEDVKQLSEDLASAIKAGDKKLSGKILDALDKKIKEYKEKKEEDA